MKRKTVEKAKVAMSFLVSGILDFPKEAGGT